jgi:hypothetical protein
MSDIDKTTMATGAVEVEPRRGGIVRLTTARTVQAVCRSCDRTFPTTGTAASHARASGHEVECDYAVRFVFRPGGDSR